MNFSKIILGVLLLATESYSTVVLSEIMFNPSGDERTCEYIELYNTSKTQAVSLEGFLLTDDDGIDQIKPVSGQMLLQPEQFALVLSPKYYEESTEYDDMIPSEALLLTIHNTQFGAYGLYNTKGERVSLLTPDSIKISSYTYTPDNQEGESEEKIDLYGKDTQDNWGNSIAGGTPGFLNSISPAPYDLSIEQLEYIPSLLSEKDSLCIHLTLKNKGFNPVSDIELIVELLADSMDTTGTVLFESKIESYLDASDSIRQKIILPPFDPGSLFLLVSASVGRDDRPANNRSMLPITCHPSYSTGCVIINEINYDPRPGSCEWVELYNNSHHRVNLHHWHFSDKRTSMIIQDSVAIKPEAYLLLGSSPFNTDSLHWIECDIPTLNNNKETLTLSSPLLAMIDSVHYTDAFGGGDGRSLERIEFSGSSTNPENWSGCTDSSGHTAGYYNSNSPKQYDIKLESSSFRPAKPQQGETVVLSAVVKNIGRSDLNNITIEWLTRSLSDSCEQSIGTYSISFLARKDTAGALIQWVPSTSGTYQLLTKACHSKDQVLANNVLLDTISTSAQSRSAVITEILYNPIKGMSECIELYNNSKHSLELFGWKITDSHSSEPYNICNSSFLLLPQHYCVLSCDSLKEFQSDHWIVTNLPSLHNDSDMLKLSDSNGSTMDSLIYYSTWGGEKGRSLERIHADLSSNNPHNWSTCVHPDGHTLGSENSNFIPIQPHKVNLSANPNPFSPNQDGIEDHTVIQYQLAMPTELMNLKIFDIHGRLVRFLLNNDKSPIENCVIWDGKNDNGLKCRIGIYIILLEALNLKGKTIDRKKATVILADQL